MKIKANLLLFFIIFISTLATLVNTASAAISITDADAAYEIFLSSVSVPTSPVPIKTAFVINADTSSDQILSSVSIPTQPSPLKEIFTINEDAALKKNLSAVSIPTEPLPVKEIFIHNAEEAILTKSLVPKGVSKVFDTRAPANPYPSIFGTHNGTIKPSHDVTINKMYTYPCSGTGGHSEFVRIWVNGIDVNATWNGYKGDWHNITFNESFTLQAGVEYNYTIRTGSYPQIHHTDNLEVANGMGTITCDKFIDANGRIYYDWIPAIKLSL